MWIYLKKVIRQWKKQSSKKLLTKNSLNWLTLYFRRGISTNLKIETKLNLYTPNKKKKKQHALLLHIPPDMFIYPERAGVVLLPQTRASFFGQPIDKSAICFTGISSCICAASGSGSLFRKWETPVWFRAVLALKSL